MTQVNGLVGLVFLWVMVCDWSSSWQLWVMVVAFWCFPMWFWWSCFYRVKRAYPGRWLLRGCSKSSSYFCASIGIAHCWPGTVNQETVCIRNHRSLANSSISLKWMSSVVELSCRVLRCLTCQSLKRSFLQTIVQDFFSNHIFGCFGIHFMVLFAKTISITSFTHIEA